MRLINSLFGFLFLFTIIALPQDNFSLRELFALNIDGNISTSAYILPDQQVFITSGDDGYLRQFDLVSGKETSNLKISDSPIVSSLVFENMLYAVTTDKKLHSVSLSPFSLVGSSDINDSPSCLTAGVSELFIGFDNGSIKRYDLSTKAFDSLFISHISPVTAILRDPNKELLISAGTDNKIKLYDLSKRSEVGLLMGTSNSKANSLALSSDGSTLISAHDDNMLKVWKMSESRQIKNINEHNSPVYKVLFSHDNSFFVSGGKDKILHIWNGYSYKLMKSVSLKEGELTSLSLSSDDKYMLAGVAPNIIKVFEVSNGSNLIAGNLPNSLKRSNMTFSDKIIIEITEPKSSRGLKISGAGNSLTVAGRIISPSALNSLTINEQEFDFASDYSFSCKVNLALGEAKLLIRAIDVNNNYNEKEIQISNDIAGNNSSTDISQIGTGSKFYAVLIGVDTYKDSKIPTLSNPTKDATNLRDILTKRYTFDKENVVLLKNPSRAELLLALGNLRKKITEEDNFLIFYAGHGFWDRDISQGYWLPSDAEKDNRANWISNGDLRDNIRGIKSKHTLLISDACFSGGIFKTRAILDDAPPSVNEVYKMTSRKGMTSGTLTEVPDESPFLKYLVKRLSDNNQKYLPAESLFSSLKTAVINNSKQVPQYGEIQDAGDEGGDFIFILKK
ncbi:MAG: hypothetical protein AB9882_04850 [Ignavibacteriaceae bacterium]